MTRQEGGSASGSAPVSVTVSVTVTVSVSVTHPVKCHLLNPGDFCIIYYI